MTTRVTSDPKSAKNVAMCVTMTGMLKKYYKHCKSSRSETVVGVLEEQNCFFRAKKAPKHLNRPYPVALVQD